MKRYRVTFKRGGRDKWSRVVRALDPRNAILKARDEAEWLDADVEESDAARVDELP